MCGEDRLGVRQRPGPLEVFMLLSCKPNNTLNGENTILLNHTTYLIHFFYPSSCSLLFYTIIKLKCNFIG